MNGQTVLSKDDIIKNFIERVNPYDPPKADYKMDLRAYARYVYDNNLTGDKITAEIMNMFVQKKKE